MRLPIKSIEDEATTVYTAGSGVQKGQIYFITQGKNYMDNKGPSRPAIIVSENGMNENSDRIMVIFLTTRENGSSYHVPVMVEQQQSYAICENINTIYKDRLDNCVGMVTEQQMKAIEKNMRTALGMKAEIMVSDNTRAERKQEVDSRYEEMRQRAEQAENDLKFYRRMYDDLFSRVMAR